MKELFAIVVKETKTLLRDPAGLIMLFVFPACFVFIMSVALQGTFSSPDKKEKMELMIIDNDKGDTGEKIINGLEKTGYFKAVREINGQKLTFEMAKKQLIKGKYKIIVDIPEDATEALNFKKTADISILVDPALPNDFASQITNAVQLFVHVSIIKNIGEISNNIFDEVKKSRISELNVEIAIATKKRNEISAQLNKIKDASMDKDIKDIFNDIASSSINDLNEKISEFKSQLEEYQSGNVKFTNTNINDIIKKNQGLFVKQKYYSAETNSEIFPNSVQQNVPGWTIFALFWIVQTLSINIIQERETGAYRRILISPISTFTYLLGKTIPFFVINLLQAVVMFCIGIFILPLVGCPALEIKNVLSLILLTISISFTSISLGLLISSICKSGFVAASVSALVVIVMMVVGGIMVPKFVMPKFMQVLSMFVPQGWALDGYLNILVRDFTLVQIIPNILTLLGFTAFFFILAMILFKNISKLDS